MAKIDEDELEELEPAFPPSITTEGIRVLEDLSEEEKYLWSILSDQSGLDLAEFAILDEENVEDRCFRAWPFQYAWWRDRSQYSVDRGARSIGKSRSIQFRCAVFPIVHPGQEMVVTAPESYHLDLVLHNAETVIRRCRLLSGLLEDGRVRGITHKPWRFNFKNGARIVGLIPNKDGKTVKGSHPLWLEQDEASDYPEAGWTELYNTIKEHSANSQWRAHGVTRGVRDTFHKITTEPDSIWKIHALPALYRPTLTPEEVANTVQKYGGSKLDPDFRRNFYGLPGDDQSPIFLFANIMKCVDQDKKSDFNNNYNLIEISQGRIEDRDGDIMVFMNNLAPCDSKDIWMGMDVGFVNDPSVIVVFDEETYKGEGRLKLLTRVIMRGVSAPDQTKLMIGMIDHYRPRAYSMDSTGSGLPLFQFAQRMLEQEENIRLSHVMNRIKPYNFGEKIIVGFDPDIEYDHMKPDGFLDAALYRYVKDQATDNLRLMIDSQKILLPKDMEIVSEFQFTTAGIDNKSPVDSYGKHRSYSKGNDHTLDACRMAVLGYKQQFIEDMIEAEKAKKKFIPQDIIFVDQGTVNYNSGNASSVLW